MQVHLIDGEDSEGRIKCAHAPGLMSRSGGTAARESGCALGARRSGAPRGQAKVKSSVHIIPRRSILLIDRGRRDIDSNAAS